MSTQSKAVANWFLDQAEREGRRLTPMQVLKLAYIAHGWHLAEHDHPLLDEPVQAWKFGPVVPSLYHEFKGFGSSPINRRATEIDVDQNLNVSFLEPTLAGDTAAFLDRVWRGYCQYSGPQLMKLTHQDGTPWDEVWNKQRACDRRGGEIPNDLIKSHFEQKRR